jgi:hypothetical protein
LVAAVLDKPARQEAPQAFAEAVVDVGSESSFANPIAARKEKLQ